MNAVVVAKGGRKEDRRKIERRAPKRGVTIRHDDDGLTERLPPKRIRRGAAKRLHNQTSVAAALVKKLGYSWHPERVERIAIDMAESINEGVPARWALTNAFSLELDMYGDGSITNPIGFAARPSPVMREKRGQQRDPSEVFAAFSQNDLK